MPISLFLLIWFMLLQCPLSNFTHLLLFLLFKRKAMDVKKAENEKESQIRRCCRNMISVSGALHNNEYL